MAKKTVKESVIELPEHAVSWLWLQLVKKFVEKPESKVPESLVNDPQKFWRNSGVRERFYIDFSKITGFNNSKMRLFSRSNQAEIGDISRNYLRDHFINRKEKLFQEDYLNKILFYLTEDQKTSEFNSIFDENGININIDEPNRGEIPPGLIHLEGYWIGLNRNLEEGAYAKCFYRFLQVDNLMQVKREAYSSEIEYNGHVHVQGDSNFLIDLVGKTRGKKKFIIADSEKLRPQSIRCLSSGFSISTGNPIHIKELLVKLPNEVSVKISNGSLIEDENLKNYLSVYYDAESLQLVMDEIEDFLGKEEVPCISLGDLCNIKKHQLKKINESVVLKHTIAKKVSTYVHFNRFEENFQYSRNIVKYYQSVSNNEESAIRKAVKVYDEYLYIKHTQYEHEDFIKHSIHEEAEDPDGVVDVQSLFPILDNDSDNDLKMPSWRVSNRVMDAYSDSFMSSATYINDFSTNLRLSLHYDVETLKSEMIIDFCSTPNILQKGIYLDEVIFMYNEADGESSKLIKIKLENDSKRGIHLLNIDRDKAQIEYKATSGVDKLNEGIYSFKIDFVAEKDEVLYFQFKMK